MKVAFHAINGVGLGHLVRTMCLAREIRALAPACDLLVVTNAADTSMLAEASIDFVKLPPRANEPHADPRRARVALPEALEEAALIATFEAFAPDLVVFDTHAPLRVVRHLATIGVRSVLVLRELREEALRSFVAKGSALLFDRIVVPHDPDEVDVSLLADLPVSIVGPIVRTVTAASTRSEAPKVVAMAGGGGQPVDAKRYLRAVVDAHRLARARVPNLETVLVTGPYGKAPAHLEGYDGLTVLASTKDLPSLLASATLVVSQAGYNAIAELRALRKPAVLVPGHRKAEDQRARARRLVKAGAAVIARPEARSIADRVEAILLDPSRQDAMRAAHDRSPLVPRNREAALAVLSPIWRPVESIRSAVVVAHDFAPKLGGMETVARTLASSLIERGVTTHVYTTSRLGARIASGLTPSNEGAGEIVRPIYRQRPPPLRIDLEADLLATLACALRDAPDVIHLSHAGLGPWIPTLRAAFPACVVTVNVHGNDLIAPWVYPGDAMTPDQYRAAQIAGLNQAHAVLCVSGFSRALAESKGVSPSVLVTIENGIDPSLFAGASLAKPDDETLLTVSRLAPRKGHRTVIQAVALLAKRRPRLRYVFTGASDAMRAELMAFAKSLGVEDRVSAIGFVPEGDLPRLYRSANVFVLLSESNEANDDVEGFGVALLEAAASGLPTIASRSGGMPEAIVDGETGLLVTPGNAEEAAAAIERLLDDRALATELGERGRMRVASRFSHTRAAERALATWASLAATRSAPLPPVAGGLEVLRDAQRRAADQRAEREQRRETFRQVLTRHRVVRLRATSDGARLLPEALDDCAALDHRPRVEVKLRRFLEPDFALYALPMVEGVELVHGLPSVDPASLVAQLRDIARGQLARVRTVRLFLTPEAHEDASIAIRAVPEAHALRRLFTEHGAVVVPPPELMRYLSEVPAGGPETGMIEPTNLCNLACPTCPTGTGKIKPLPQMTLAKFESVIEEVAPRMRNLALWNYGEPLLNKELPRMIASAKKAGVKVVKVSSNVHFLDGARGRALLESGLDVLILSVDGASQATYATFRKDGSFEQVATSVAWLCAEKKRLGLKKPRIELQFIAMRHNEHELPEMRRLAREWGVDKLRVKTVGADDEGTKDLVPASRLLSRYEADHTTPNVRHAFCTMAWDHTVVNVDGSVTPCCYLRPDMGEAFVMGNIFETPFTSIWRGERYRAFREAMLNGRGSMPVCNRCRGGTHDLIAAIEDVSS